ncbi:response regulator [Erwinia aphidicola]
MIFSTPGYRRRLAASKAVQALGLAICSQLVQMMGGNIFMESQPGNGTRVTFTLTVPARDYTPAAVSAPTDADDGEITSLRILAVDDHPANLMLLRRQLARLGHTISEACDGEQGWEMWQQQEFDLVITDCSMPGMDGLELTRLIRQHQQQPVMIVGLTANAWPEERARCQQAGMDDCMFKPLQLPQLKTMLRQVSRQLGETQIPAEERPVTLEQLVNFPALQQLTQNDDELLHELLHELLQTTSATNQQGLVQAGDLVELEDWPELAKCIHRLSGAAQIISAFKVEALCRELESVCREENVDRQRVHLLWQQVQKDSQVLEAAMQRWLSQD